MATKKTEIIEEPLAPAAPALGVERAHVERAQARRMPGLAIAGIAVGGVIVAGALFGGGVVVGTNLPAGGAQFGASQGPGRDGFPGGPNGMAGPGPVMPGQHRPNQQSGQNP